MTASNAEAGGAPARPNYFGFATAAERYVAGRPYLHPLAIRRIGGIVSPAGRLRRALDVGCGTGLSTLALAEIAEAAVGADLAFEMLRHAPRSLAFVQARAEALPFPAAAFDLITVGHALHWFDREPFLDEAARLLRPGGWLAVYANHFLARMVGNPEFERWQEEVYARRYPAPPRNHGAVGDADIRRHGLAPAAHEDFEHTLAWTPDELVAFQLSHSNVIAAAEAGNEDIAAIAAWLTAAVTPMFSGPVAEFAFRCHFDLFRREEQRPPEAAAA